MNLGLPCSCVVAGLLFGACAGRNVPAQAEAASAADQVTATGNSLANSRSNPLFLFLLAPRYYTDPPIPPECLATARIHPGEPISVRVRGYKVLSGQVVRRGGSYFAQLEGFSHGTLNDYRGPMQLEQPVNSQGGMYSGAIFPVRFVLSTNSNPKVFLREEKPGQ